MVSLGGGGGIKNLSDSREGLFSGFFLFLYMPLGN